VLYDLKVSDSSVRQLENGRYEVDIDIEAHKFEATGGGQEEEVPISDWVDIGILGEEQGELKIPEVIFMQKFNVTNKVQHYRITVDKEPVSVGIDPMNKLIDRNPSDNIVEVNSAG
jgi:hypothetical protein